MRVAQVVCTDAFAGVERYVVTLATGLAEQGHEVLVFGGGGESMPSRLEPFGVQWTPGTSTVEAARWLRRQRDLDVVHVHMTKAETAAALSRRRRTPLVSTRHFAARRGSSRPARLFGRYLTHRVDLQLAISDFVAERIEGRCLVVRPGVPVADPGPPAARRAPVVLMAQRLEREKESATGITAWAESGLAAKGWQLLVAGDGQERSHLEALAGRLGVSASTRFLGHRRDVDTLQRDAAIFLATAPAEPFGLSVVEAMAVATPVVATASGGHLETVGALSGAATYPSGEAATAGQLLAQLATDPDARADYGQRLRQHQVQHLSAAGQVAATLDAYRRLI